ncbi:MAG: NAD(P)/FAD-dependent oxidoreductase, partial [Pseudomonadota bacterium]
PCHGMFVAVGQQPNTDLFKNQIDLDENGFIKTRSHSAQTSVQGIFAAGDVADRIYHQAIAAAGMGCKAALDAERWLASLSY